jgi:hypothetical protein
MEGIPTTRAAIRLYNNPRFGKGLGPKRINHFVFNGTVEFPDKRSKFCVDLADLDHLQDGTDPRNFEDTKVAVMAMADQLGYAPGEASEFLAGQLKTIKPYTYQSTILVIDMRRWRSIILGYDDMQVTVYENIVISPCSNRREGVRAPDYFGSNYQLETDPLGGSALAKTQATQQLSALRSVTR